MTSDDYGLTWTTRTSAADNNWYSVTWGNNLFVATSTSGTGDRVMTSPDGVTWTLQTSAANNSWFGVTYGAGLFVAVAYSAASDRVMYSSDGVTWTGISAQAGLWFDVIYADSQFVAVGTNCVMTSPDGVTWTLGTCPNGGWRSVTYGDGIYVAVATSGTGRVMTSPDGVTWTLRTAAAVNTWISVEYGNGYFVAVSQTGTSNRSMISSDGVTWTSIATTADEVWNAMCFGAGIFIAVAESTTTVNRFFGILTSINVECLTECLNPVYLKWINDYGGISTWLFSYNQLYDFTPQTLWRDKILTVEANGLTEDQWFMLQELNKNGLEYGDNQKLGTYCVDITDEAYPVNVFPLSETSGTLTKKARHNFSLQFRYAQIPNILL
jgi:hypothetical protein